MPVLAPVETAWIPAELVATPAAMVVPAVERAAMPVLAPVETAWMPAELVAVAVDIAFAVALSP